MNELLKVENLSVEITTRRGIARVVDGLTLAVPAGETFAIVGESGCGKSMTALTVMGLLPAPEARVTSGHIWLEGEDLLAVSEARRREVRGNRVAMIFQEPMTSLNPVFTVGEQIAEAARAHLGLSRRAAWGRAIEMMQMVHIPAPEKRAQDYPHQFSGGMRQRAMIAMALVCEPKLIIADEPTTALDVTIQAQIFELLLELQRSRGTTLVLITHDMAAVSEVARRVMVMYAGRKVEEGDVENVLSKPMHPYTKGLLACRLRLAVSLTGEREPLPEIPGVVPSLDRLGPGCHFAPRCQFAMPRCLVEAPPLFGDEGRGRAACWLIQEDSPQAS